MGYPPSLPPTILSAVTAATTSTLLLIRDPSDAVVGVVRRLPPSVALPGGLSCSEFPREALASLPPGTSDELGQCVLLRWRGRCAGRIAGTVVIEGRVVGEEGVRKDVRKGALDVVVLERKSAEDVPIAPWLGSAGDDEGFDLDVLAYVRIGATGDEILSAVGEGIERQLVVMRVCKGGKVRHFRIIGEFVVSILRSRAEEREDEDGEESVSRRVAEHEDLMLGIGRRALRRGCAIDVDMPRNAWLYRTDGGWEGRLANVHFGIKGHGMGEKGVSVHLVSGRYLYCHYMQDKLNDSGWGCAYRSLQTLMSWCASQGLVSFTNGLLPTHREIQAALVAVGDKPSKFVGSKEWIGANECCYALEQLTGVESKILHVSSGAEIEGRGRELARHFDQQGSPVMIGGGVLAWTIMGVARDSRTGRAKFLILDPHYEGMDNLAVIQGKGWIGWKGSDIFKSTAFYNMCMPMRPSLV